MQRYRLTVHTDRAATLFFINASCDGDAHGIATRIASSFQSEATVFDLICGVRSLVAPLAPAAHANLSPPSPEPA